MKKEKVVLLDVSAIMYRAYFANMNFRSKNEPTGAIYGFYNTLMSIIKELEPKYIGAAFDVRRSSLKRSEIYKEYKAQREAAPEDLITQIPRIEELLDCFNINRFKVEGYEADDILGTIATLLSKEGLEIFIITGDKDLAQVLGENVKIALLGKGDNGGLKIVSSEDDVVEYLGVTSDKIPDLFGLIGDSSDGIPGVRKIGIKKAVPMLEKYNSLEGIYENLDSLSEIPGIGKTLITNLVEDKKLAFLSKELATIYRDVPLNLTLEDLNYKVDKEKLLKLFKELEFKSFIKKLGLERENEKKLKISTNRVFKVVNSVKELQEIKMEFKNEKILSIYGAELGLAISGMEKDWYIPYTFSKVEEQLSLFAKPKISVQNEKEYFSEIENIFVNYTGKIIVYNLKKLLKMGIKIEECEMDIMIAYHLLTSQTRENIELPIKKMTDINLLSYEEKFGKVKVETLTPQEYGKFLTTRTSGLIECYDLIKMDLEDKNLIKVLYETEMPLVMPLAVMERKGIKINPEYFNSYNLELTMLLQGLEEKIYKEAGEIFNINSPKQLGEILFFKLNYSPIKKTKTGLSTDEEVLEQLKKDGAKIAEYILEFRKLAKLKNTYVEAIPKLRDECDRVHTTFHQIGTVTGRLSSSDPNLQNIPAKTDEGMKIRKGFVAEKDYVLMGIDYSQIELRVLAELSGDTVLRESYQNNEDLHNLTAKKIFELKAGEEVTREQRIIGKTLNFSIIYGKTPFGLAKELNISTKEASRYIERYFAQYPKVKEFEKEIISFTEKNGYTETYFGRRRLIEGINSNNKNIKSQAERMAVNSVIQGTAAEIIKKVMIQVFEYIKDKEGIYLLLQVHDELIFEVHRDKVLEYQKNIENIMKNTVKFDNVELEINTNIGIDWAEAK